jgi:Zn-dependent peptidase ImmA (M78 family)
MRNIIANKKLSEEEVLELFQIPLTPPIDLMPIINKLNITIEKDLDLENSDNIGYIKVKDNDVVIWVNPLKNVHITRERFTIAHELGHLFLHIAPKNVNIEFKDTEENLTRNNYWNFQEYEANNFAARLLMPKELIKEYALKLYEKYKKQYNSIPTKEDFIKMMANSFNVSKQAMEYRLKNIGIV